MRKMPLQTPVDQKLINAAVQHANRRVDIPQKFFDALAKNATPITFERLFPLVDEVLKDEKNGVKIGTEFQKAFHQVSAWSNIFELFIDITRDTAEHAHEGSTSYYERGQRILLPIFLVEAGAAGEEEILLGKFFGEKMGKVSMQALIEFVKKTDFERSRQLFSSLYATAFDMHRDYCFFTPADPEFEKLKTKDMFHNPLVSLYDISKAVLAHFKNPPDLEYARNLEGHLTEEQLPLLQELARIVEEKRTDLSKP